MEVGQIYTSHTRKCIEKNKEIESIVLRARRHIPERIRGDIVVALREQEKILGSHTDTLEGGDFGKSIYTIMTILNNARDLAIKHTVRQGKHEKRACASIDKSFDAAIMALKYFLERELTEKK